MHLDAYLKAEKLGNREFGEKIGVTEMTVCRYRKGRMPKPQIAVKLIAATNGAVTADDLVAVAAAAKALRKPRVKKTRKAA